MAIIYRHIKPSGEVFYIGIGSRKDRAYSKHRRNNLWKNIVKKHGYRVELLSENISKEQAIELEMILISWYGRRDNNTGILVNMTNGGEGLGGYISSEDRKAKLRKANNGGKNPSAKKVIHIETGVIYDCIKDASIALKIKHYTLYNSLSGRLVNKTKLKYYE